LINPLTLGNTSFPVNIIQGPLAGVSTAPFRHLIWQYSKPAFSCTEMISCKTLLHQSNASKRFLAKDVQEGPVCFQLSGNCPEELAQATKIVTDHGADLIDLNCGCPVNKIRSKGAGSSLLMKPVELYALITAMKANTHVPVSIKIRVDGHSKDSYNAEIAKVVHEAGADFLVVHGRHWTEHYETPCNYEQIQFFVEQLKIPVIGNGDIACITSLKKMFATGCHGVMLGRASVGQPWLIGQLIKEMQGKPYIPPAISTRGALFMQHVIALSELLNSEKFAVIQARKFAKYYARDVSTKVAFCQAVNTCETLETLHALCLQHFID
jgi:tRNA-dihydrouridine synthase B